MFQATRRRLALWYTAVTAILLLSLALGMYFYVRATLIDRIDDTLKHVVEVVNRSLVVQSFPPSQGRYQVDLEASFPSQGKAVEDDHIDLEWFSPQGDLLWSTFTETLAVPLHPTRYGQTIRLNGDHILRQVTERVEIDRHVLGYIRVSHPWFEVSKPIRQLSLDLMVGMTLMVACVAGIGWFLSGIAIQPVKDSYQSLKQFTADASHELRNPIAMIQTNAQIALAYPETQSQRLKVIERLTKRLGNLVNDLLFLARSDSGIIVPGWQSVPLDALLMEVIEEQRVFSEQKKMLLSLTIIEDDRFSEQEFAVWGDWDQLARLFTNLIGNAIEHSGSPSCKVELRGVKRDFLQVRVTDEGKGISESALPYIFDRFYRADPARTHSGAGSSGLGLAIVKAITESHHGHVSVEVGHDRGTSFIVDLPRLP
ncbi:MAG: Adaptive-response sensory-kinase SasA [Chroococcopsis gigantea SAG 12.99]|jgi:OmpR-family two-component system manganese-sensing sensor histidine kinase|nr:sensor histidine kinase [Chlorogloea purpurea SAG 13.99]MDV2999614.1 Adaptive-response sensory-kinase SasA [Chroococcopsis gigantea SAG 12.99]